MAKHRKKRKRSGHFCWSCGQHRPNEHFSGRGHAHHLCKDCSKLGKEELEYRQHVRNIDRLVDWDGRIRRKQRRTFERYLSHPNERVLAYAQQIKGHDEKLREEYHAMRQAEELEMELWADRCVHDDDSTELGIEPEGSASDQWDEWDDIPF